MEDLTKVADVDEAPKSAVPKKDRSTIIRKILANHAYFLNPLTGEKELMPVGQAVAFSLIRKALQGDIPAIKECLDSAYGPIKAESEISGTHEIVFRWAGGDSPRGNAIEIRRSGGDLPQPPTDYVDAEDIGEV